MTNNLKATKRETKTKGQLNTLRSKGFIPAVLYGGKSPNLKLSINEKFVNDVLRSENFLSTVIDLDIDGKKEKVIPRDVTYHVTSEKPTHIDFMRIVSGKKIILEIPVKFIDGKSGSLDVLASIKSQYKFIHLDANKSYEGTLDDLEKYNSFCDGVICVDDYLQSMWPEVTRATDDFVKNSEWNRILIGNHQVFLSRKKQTPASRKITLKFPVVLRNDEVHLTYGKLPEDVDRFMEVTNKKMYTWHTTAWK